MAIFSPTVRISFCLVSIALSVFFLAMGFGLVPDYYASRLESRKSYCEHLAIHCSLATQHEDLQTLKNLVQAAVRRNPDIMSVGIRGMEEQSPGNPLLLEIGDHQEYWNSQLATMGNSEFVNLPIFEGRRRWGSLELRFQPMQEPGLLGLIYHPVARFYLFFCGVSAVAFYGFVRFFLRQLDGVQSRVVPRRVRATLNTLAEGVVILNKEGRIVMANEAFARTTGSAMTELEGQKVSELGWSAPINAEKTNAALPWEYSLTAMEPQTGIILNFNQDDQPSTLAVNSTPILGEDGALRGVLASFDNLTTIEEKNTSLRRLLKKLEKSRKKIKKQNLHLHNLATKDPLTGCWNRRMFYEAFTSHWAAHDRDGRSLCCIMVDIDFFKSINDNHGHSSGDKVLQGVAALLQKEMRQTDLICRYGGEEFCILLPGQEIAAAMKIAERLRKKIETLRPMNLPVTASLGVAGTSQKARNMQDLVDHADKALYVAKRTGRNKVKCWDKAEAGQVFDLPANSQTAPRPSGPQPEVPFQAVNILLTTLNYRHAAIAEHSRRVADLCVSVATGILPQRDAYLLEMVALLHDIGKLGVPDTILLKPGPLTAEEWRILKRHEDLGEELIAIAFSSKKMTEIIRGYHLHFGGDPERKGAPTGEDIPLSARILAIADAFDSMVTDQTYRKGRTRQEAFQELIRCAGKQFDPYLVELFIQRISEQDPTLRIA